MEKKTWKVYLKEGDVKSFLVKHTEKEIASIEAKCGCKLTSPSGTVIFVNESNIACIVEHLN